MTHLRVGESIPRAGDRHRFHILRKEKLLRLSAGERNAPEMPVGTVEKRLAVRSPGDTGKTLRGPRPRHFTRFSAIGGLHVDRSDSLGQHTDGSEMFAVW